MTERAGDQRVGVDHEMREVRVAANMTNVD